MSVNTVVAVIDATETEVIVWHVDTGPGSDLGRLCGAWVMFRNDDQRLQTLVRDRFVLTTPAGLVVLLAEKVSHRGTIDTARIVASLSDCCATLQNAYEVNQVSRGVKLVPPSWPSLPADDLSKMRAASADPTVAQALGIARWLVDASAAWAQIEQQRLARPYLTELGGPRARPLPLAS